MDAILDLVLNKETVFFGLFMWLFFEMMKDKKEQNIYLRKQQKILDALAKSVEKLTEEVKEIKDNLGGKVDDVA